METHNEAVALALERIAQAVEGIKYALAGVVKTEDVGKKLRSPSEGDLPSDLVRSMQESKYAWATQTVDTLLDALKVARPYVYVSIHPAAKSDLARIDAAILRATCTVPVPLPRTTATEPKSDGTKGEANAE